MIIDKIFITLLTQITLVYVCASQEINQKSFTLSVNVVKSKLKYCDLFLFSALLKATTKPEEGSSVRSEKTQLPGDRFYADSLCKQNSQDDDVMLGWKREASHSPFLSSLFVWRDVDNRMIKRPSKRIRSDINYRKTEMIRGCIANIKTIMIEMPETL